MAHEGAISAAEHLERGCDAQDRGDVREALDHFEKYLLVQSRLMAAMPTSAEPALHAAWCGARIGRILKRQGALDSALSCFQTSIELCSRFLEKGGEPSLASHAVASFHMESGRVLVEQADMDGALRHYQEALTLWRSVREEEPALDVPCLSCVVNCLLDVGTLLWAHQDLSGARERFQEAALIQERLMDEDPSNVGMEALAQVQGEAGHVLADCGDSEGALQRFTRCIEVRRHLVAVEPHNNVYENAQAIALKVAGQHLYLQGKADLALPYYKESLAIQLSLVASAPGDARWQDEAAMSHEALGEALYAPGDHSGALVHHQESQQLWLSLLAKEPRVRALARRSGRQSRVSG